MPNRRNRRSKNRRKGKNLESSTPSSTPPSEPQEDTQQLLQGGACGSSKSGESASAECPKGDVKRPESEERSPCRNLGATSSRDQSGNSPCKEHLDVPERESGVSASPSKTAFNKLKGIFSQKKSGNRSPTPERRGDGNRESERPESLPAEASVKPNESKPSPRKASPLPLTKKDRSQSSSSSNPSFKGSPRSVHRREDGSEMHHLDVPGKKREVSPKSPTKKSFFQQCKERLSPKKKSPVRSECSCKDKNNHESNCLERKDASPKRSLNKSGSPGNASPSSRRRNCSEDSTTTSGSSNFPSFSKASSASAPSSKNSPGPNRSVGTSGYSSGDTSPSRSDSLAPPRNLTDYDPQEGTSRGRARERQNGEQWSNFDHPYVSILGSFSGIPQPDELLPLIENMDFDDSEDEERNLRGVQRRRSKSFGAQYSFRSRRPRNPRPGPRDGSPRPGPRDVSPRPGPRDVSPRPGPRDVSPRPGPRDVSPRPGPRDVSPRVAADRRREWRLMSEELHRRMRSLPAESPECNAGTATTPLERRHLSASQYSFLPSACDCGNSYLHDISCAREIAARRRRKLRRCRQDVPR